MNRKPGFTLIEVLTVTVIIGVLAAIAIPQYYRVKGKAYLAAMQSDLRNLVTAEEAYFAEFGRYSTDPSELPNFRISSGVRIEVRDADLQGWVAVATHSASTASCSIFVGRDRRTSDADPESEGEGIPTCDAGVRPSTGTADRQP